MILKHCDWQSIREQFTEDERDAIREHIDGQVVCPRGWSLDTQPMNGDLRVKLMDAVTKLHKDGTTTV